MLIAISVSLEQNPCLKFDHEWLRLPILNMFGQFTKLIKLWFNKVVSFEDPKWFSLHYHLMLKVNQALKSVIKLNN